MNAKTETGNVVTFLIQDKIDILLHQANCFNTMNSGVAREIREMYPEAYEMDCLTVKGDPKKLGQFSFAFVDDKAQKVICNLYGQYKYGYDKGLYTDYNALLKALENARDWLIKAGLGGKTIGIPYRMGCDRGGGDWEVVSKMVNFVFRDTDFNIIFVKWDGTRSY